MFQHACRFSLTNYYSEVMHRHTVSMRVGLVQLTNTRHDASAPACRWRCVLYLCAASFRSCAFAIEREREGERGRERERERERGRERERASESERERERPVSLEGCAVIHTCVCVCVCVTHKDLSYMCVCVCVCVCVCNTHRPVQLEGSFQERDG